METNGHFLEMAQIKDGQIYCQFTHLKAPEALGAYEGKMSHVECEAARAGAYVRPAAASVQMRSVSFRLSTNERNSWH